MLAPSSSNVTGFGLDQAIEAAQQGRLARTGWTMTHVTVPGLTARLTPLRNIEIAVGHVRDRRWRELPPLNRGSAELPFGMASEGGLLMALSNSLTSARRAGDEAGLLLADPQRVVDVVDHRVNGTVMTR